MKKRRIVGRISVLLAAFLMLSLPVLAAGGQGRTPTTPNSAIKSFTNAAGNWVPPEEMASNPALPRLLGGNEVSTWVQRGRKWWPYPNVEAPYTFMASRVDTMDTAEINVNGILMLDTRTPKASLQNVPAGLLLKPGSQLNAQYGYYLVKIEGRTRTGKEVDALKAAGAVLGEYLNINTYIAKIPSSDFGAVKSLSFVTYVGDYQPAYKISPRIGYTKIPPGKLYDSATGMPKPWLFEVQLHAGADIKEVLSALGGLGIYPSPKDVITSAFDKNLTTILARSAPDKIMSIAKIPGVKFILEHAYPHLMASSTSPAAIPMLLQNNNVYTTNKLTGWKLWNVGLDGSKSGTAQVVTMMDSGLNTEMYHFSQDTVNVGTLGLSHRKVVGYSVYGGDVCVALDGHGTMTSQHVAGDISSMTTNPDTTDTPNENWDNGIARGAKIYFEDIGTASGINPPTDLGPSLTDAKNNYNSYIQNDSWGTSSPTYDTEAGDLDAALFANPNMVVTIASGDSGQLGAGTIGSPSTAKNGICVGGTDEANPYDLFEDCDWDGTAACASTDAGSGRGPVSTSLRVKPDICSYFYATSAVGGETMAYDRPHAMCQTDTTKTPYIDYINAGGWGGTSFSAPDIAGLAAIVRDYFLSGFYPSGIATPADAITPSGSLVKAVILASGEPLNTTAYPTTTIAVAPRYSSDQGYGQVNLPSVLRIGSGAPYLWVQNRVALGDAATKTFYYTINGNSMPLRIMMDYYDAAGNALVKDCDLKVTIGSNVYWGNNFSGGWSTASTTTRDHTNNTEGVFLDAAHGLPASGTVQVDVIGYSDPGGMNFSLVASGDVASQAVTQVALDKGVYGCSSTINITVNDASATSPVSVTMTSKNSGGTTIDTQIVSCTGSNGVFTGSIIANSGLIVQDGGSITATYVDGGGTSHTTSATIDCQIKVSDGGFTIDGGCDNTPADPSVNNWVNEYYDQYMDADEYNTYTVGFNNLTGVALSDVYVSLSFSGAGASDMQVFNNPVYVGAVPVGSLTGAAFQVYTKVGTPGLTSVNMNFAITSPADGYTTPVTLTQVQLLQANDTIVREYECHPFNTGLSGGQDLVLTTNGFTGAAAVANPWNGNTTAGGEDRTDGFCSSAAGNTGAALTSPNTGRYGNFAGGADSVLTWNFQPALTGAAPNGQPYKYTWKWHSFYHTSEIVGSTNTSGVWGAFYNDQWDSSTWPTGDQVAAFPISLAYYYQNIFDYVSAWNWETANTGTPDDPGAATPAPNQLLITFGSSVTGLAKTGTWFAYGHEHADLDTSGTNNKDIALDDDELAYDEYYATAQTTASCPSSGQIGVVAFDRYSYTFSGSGTAVISVTDGNATSPLTVTVTSAGTGDSEDVTLTGTGPYFSGNLILATNAGVGANNGTLFVTPNDTMTATYTDANPAGTSTSTAAVANNGGDVVYLSHAQVSDNGDNDGYADNNETVVMNITIKNNMSAALTNANVTIATVSPNIDCIIDNTAAYGTVAAGAIATNPVSDTFTFHVAPSVQCTDWQNPPIATFTVLITGDNFAGSSTLQTFQIPLDLDGTTGGVTYTLTQTFSTDPNWVTGVSANDEGSTTCLTSAYTNNFKYRPDGHAAGNGAYGAWLGTGGTFTTSGAAGLSAPDSSTLYSPVLTAGGTAVTLKFDVAYEFSDGQTSAYQGAKVQYSLNGGAWTNLDFTTPAQVALNNTADAYCLSFNDTAPLDNVWWNTTPQVWLTTNAASVTTAVNDTIQFRWRAATLNLAGYNATSGLGVDNVVITGLLQTLECETTRNTSLPGCPSTAPPPVPNNGDIPGTPFTVTANTTTPGNVDFTWDSTSCTAGNYMVLWGDVSSLSMNAGVTNGTVTSADCGLGNTGGATNQISPTPAAGQCYFSVIVGVDGSKFGREGNNSTGNERVLSGDTGLCTTATTKDTTATTCP